MNTDVQGLQEILDAGDVDRIVAYFHGRDEKERQSVAPVCVAAYRKRGDAESCAAVLASSSFSDLKKLGWQVRPEDSVALRVLVDRRPPWIDQYVTMLLDEDFYWGRWKLVRAIIRAGLSSKPDHAHYTLGMVHGLVNQFSGPDSAGIEESLLEDRALLEDEVWRIFEHEGGGENSLANYDRFARHNSWKDSLVSLSNQGYLERDRLLNCSLDALARDFNHYRARWYSEFHDALGPTDEELRARADRYLHLLASKTAPTGVWAFKIVDALDKKQPFEAEQLVDGLRPILRSRTKSTVKAALKLLDRVVKRANNGSISVLAADAAAEALLHEATEIQEACLERLESYGKNNVAVRDRVRQLRDLVAPSCRARLTTWLDGAGSEGVEKISQQSGDPQPSVRLTKEFVNRLRYCDPQLLRRAGLSDFVEPTKEHPLTAAEFDGTEIPRLASQTAMAAIHDLDELMDVAARCIEEPGLIDDIERVFAGLSQLCCERPADFQPRVHPLEHRVTKLLKTRKFAFGGFGPEDDLCGTIYAWITGEVPEPNKKDKYCSPFIEGMWTNINHVERTLMGFYSRRALSIAKRVAVKNALPRLSAPTHEGGWIDPLAVAERVQSWIDKNAEPDLYDVILLMLRLAPDNRSRALNQISESRAEWIQALRYALGGAIEIGATAPLWATAARSRAPWQDDQAVEARHPKLGPDAGSAAKYEWREYLRNGKWPAFCVEVKPSVTTSVNGHIPTVLFHRHRSDADSVLTTTGRVRWASLIWPLAQESFFAAGAQQLGFNLDWWEAQWANKHFLEPMLNADVPLRPMARFLLAIALSAKQPSEYQLGIDIAVNAIDDGRLDSEILGGMLRELYPSRQIKAARWAKTLVEVARVSALHAWTVRKGLEASLRAEPRQIPRDLHTLLELLFELSFDAQDAVRDAACRQVLSGFTGANKAAKAAKKLLELVPDEAHVHHQWTAAAERALVQRSERLERWIHSGTD